MPPDPTIRSAAPAALSASCATPATAPGRPPGAAPAASEPAPESTPEQNRQGPAAAAAPGPPAACTDPDEQAAWLRLLLTEGLGPASLVQLLRAVGAPARILEASVARLAGVVTPAIARHILAPDRERAQHIAASLAWLRAAPDHHLLTLADEAYPAAWLHLSTPPPAVMVHGRLDALAVPALAIVGSRHASSSGAGTARAFAGALAGQGWCVVSGLALGIDAAAHAGALDAGGPTVAFVGTGIDISYPARNRRLAQRIATNGAIVSEFPLGTRPLPGNFPRRNRLIAAHALGVLVVEAARRSGSLITALAAAEIGREVFAVPGSIHSPLSQGCHWLIRQGACLVAQLDDLLGALPAPQALAATPGPCRAAADDAGTTPPVVADAPAGTHTAEGGSAPAPHSRLPATCARTLAGLGWDPGDVDTLALGLGLTVSETLAALLELELAGLAERLPDGRFVRHAQAGQSGARRGPPGSGALAQRGERPV